MVNERKTKKGKRTAASQGQRWGESVYGEHPKLNGVGGAVQGKGTNVRVLDNKVRPIKHTGRICRKQKDVK